jgi:DNA polymerase I-like protein with 3'-5' exonuclease and polymerase domains
VLLRPTLSDLKALLPEGDTSVHAIDLETTGTTPEDPECKVVWMGIANATRCFSFDTRYLDDETRAYLYARLSEVPLVAHNAIFDAGFLTRDLGRWLNWEACTFALFQTLTTEGHVGQQWGLEAAQRLYLGWPESNKTTMTELLKKHGLAKSDMSKLADLEPQLFGEYCALDAEAAYQLYNELTKTIAAMGQPGVALTKWHKRLFMPEVKLLIEQQLRGIRVDLTALCAYRDELTIKIEDAMQAFLTHGDVAPTVTEYRDRAIAEWKAAEPPKLTKANKVSARWEAWYLKGHKVLDTRHFNPNSKQQLEYLFYDKLGYKPAKYTEGGRRAVDKESLPLLGPAGKLLVNYNKLVKELGYVTSCIGHTRPEMGETTPEVQGAGDSDPANLRVGRFQPDAAAQLEGIPSVSAS